MNTWIYATIPDEAATAREDARIERERGCAPLDFTFTPQDRDMVQMARLDVLARARSFGRATSGPEVTEVAYTDLSETERAAFGERAE